jgi:hypothetical protein
MFNTVSPDDRRGLVAQQHDEWRQQAAFDRGMVSRSAARMTSDVEAPQHHRLQALRQLFHPHAWGHRSPRGMTH